ncbi:MAG TPA: hypothetical protein VN821_08680 [Candidatus Udaeobacter sp.]|nr:hypothetical protein [Candidatus Udaeobacter sp.]
MRIGELLIRAELATPQDIEAALQRQNTEGGRLGENLIAMGIVDRKRLERLLRISPAKPASIAELQIKENDLLDLLMKLIFVNGLDTTSQFVEGLKLPHPLVAQLGELAASRQLLNVSSARGSGMLAEKRYDITEAGRQWAAGAMSRSQYIGPAPVSLDAFKKRIVSQRISGERVTLPEIKAALSGLFLEETLMQKMGPAINSGKPILLYGPPGNGKTSIALKLGRTLTDLIYVPYSVMIEGQIMRVYDPKLHSALLDEEGNRDTSVRAIRDEEFDGRWVPCRQPFAVAGGELTLEMLELGYDPISKCYEAPLHVKALGGSILIDDFGRQLVSPADLLNRWIVPLENGVDYLKLQTGKSFDLPFEARLMFSTNLEPEDLMDPAFLRRLPFKLEIGPPSRKRFRRIFDHVAKSRDIPLSEEMFEFIIQELTEKRDIELAAYQPGFITDQVVATCEFEGVKPHFEQRLIEAAISNIRVKRYHPPKSSAQQA